MREIDNGKEHQQRCSDGREIDLACFTFTEQSGDGHNSSIGRRPPNPGDMYSGLDYGDRQLAPGWQKRSIIGAAGFALFLSLLLYADRSTTDSVNSNETTVATQAIDYESTLHARREAQGNILPGVDATLSYIAKGDLLPEATEIERSNATFEYQFNLAPLANSGTARTPRQNSQAKGPVMLLRGVAAGTQREELLSKLWDAGVRVQAADGVSAVHPLNVGTMLTGVIAFALVAGLIMQWRSRKQMASLAGGGGLGKLSKHRGEQLTERPSERFDDIGGCSHVIEEFKELKADIAAVMAGDNSVYLPKGIVLGGPPGNGKTLLARALAGELGIPFIHFDSSQFTQMLKGTGPARVRDGFQDGRDQRDRLTRELSEQASEVGGEFQGVSMLFFDEFDSLGTKRDSGDGVLGDDERKNIVNSLLNEMDGLNKNKNRNVIVVAATNLMNELDPALLRPGRFTKRIEIPLPASAEQRLDILRKLVPGIVSARGKSFENEQSLLYLAKITPSRSGDDLRGILEEAVAISRRERRDQITQADVFEAYQRQFFGRIKDNIFSRKKHELIAHHEHGHALAALANGVDTFVLSMLPRGESAGRVVIDPEGLSEVLCTKQEMFAQIMIAAGGRAAERAAYGEGGITRGAKSDLDQIRSIIVGMLSDGMLADQYALNVSRMRPERLPDEHIKIINDIGSRAIDTAEKLIRRVGPTKMQRLVDDSLALDRELVGDEARTFYYERLDRETIGAIESIAKQFYQEFEEQLSQETLLRVHPLDDSCESV